MGAGLVERGAGPARSGRRSLLQSGIDCRRRRCGGGRWRRLRPRRFVDAARRSRARLFLPARRAARHAHGPRRPERRRCRRRARASASLPPSSPRSAKSTTRGRSRARSSGRATSGRSTRRARSPTSSARVVRTREGAIHPATRTFQALRIFVNDELAELARGLAAAERVLKPARAAGRGRLPLARGSHRQDLPGGAQPRAGCFAASAADRCRRRRRSACSRGGRKRRTKPRLPPTRAPARRSCAPPSAPMPRRVPTPIDALLPRLPSLADGHAGAGMILRIAQFRRDRRAGARGGLRLSHQIRFHRPGRASRQAAQRGAARARHDRGVARRSGASSTIRRASRRSPSATCKLKPIAPTQFDALDQLPDRPPQFIKPDSAIRSAA